MSEEQSLKSEKKSESEASVPGEKTEEREREGGGGGREGCYCHCIIARQWADLLPTHSTPTDAKMQLQHAGNCNTMHYELSLPTLSD